MKYKTYRICLLAIVIVALIGGVFILQNMEKQQTIQGGTFVQKILGVCHG